MPVLDVPTDGAHDVIGDRAYGRTPDQVAILGRAARRDCSRAVYSGDQAHAWPRPRRRRQPPWLPSWRRRGGAGRHDFAPFRMLSDMPMAMTAHVVYTALDPHSPATTSRIVMDEIVRGYLAYDGLV